MGNTVCLQTAFGRRWRRLRLLSAVVVGLRTPALQPMHAHRGQAFQGVTPSFHLSNYQLSKQLYFVVCPLTFYRQRTSRTAPEIVTALAVFPLGVLHDNRYQGENVRFTVKIMERVIVHRAAKVDSI